MLCLAGNQGLAAQQVNFSNAFTQAKLDLSEEIYVQVPRGFECSKEGSKDVILKLSCLLCGLVQAPLCWNDHLKAALNEQGLTLSEHDPCMHISNGVIALTYINNCLFFAKNPKDINRVVSELQCNTLDQKGLKLAVKDNMCTFLGVQITPSFNGALELKQPKLIDEILTAWKMQN